jgi:hypothetical protein
MRTDIMPVRQLARFGLPAVAALVLSIGSAQAQTTAVGPYYTTPSWDQTVPPSTRFVVLSNMKSEAALDRETGLVWQRTPTSGARPRYAAIEDCWKAATGGRQGWRLPTVAELMTLGDPANNKPFETRLALGHPFVLAEGAHFFWTSDRLDDGDVAVTFGSPVESNSTGIAGATLQYEFPPFTGLFEVWCVRGGASR